MKRDAPRGHDVPGHSDPDDNGKIVAQFVDFPGATFGGGAADAMARAADLLETILASDIEDRKDIPAPSAARGRPTVAPRLLGSFKLAVYQELLQRGWRKADLARALAVNPRQIDRLLDLGHASPLSPLEAAFAALGKVARVQVVDLAA